MPGFSGDRMKDFRTRIVGFGALNWDDNRKVCEIVSPGKETMGKIMNGSPGGSAANTIIGLSRLGVKSSMIGAVGNDPYGRKIIDNLYNEGVYCLIVEKEGPTGNCIILSDMKGERSIYVFPGVNDTICCGDISKVAIKEIKSADYFHMSSFASLESPKSLRTGLKLAKKSKKLSFSPGNIYSDPESYARKKYGTEIEELFKEADVLLLNEDEARMLTGEEFTKAAEEITRLYDPKIISITLGKRGCYVKTRKDSFKISAYKPSRISDTTGAGDAFAAGFLYGLLKEKPPETCGKIGNYVASKCVEEIGSIKGLPRERYLPSF